MTFTSHQQYQFTKKQKARHRESQGKKEEEEKERDNIAIDACGNPSKDTSFTNGSMLQPRERKKSAGLQSMQQRSGEIKNDTARLLPRGKSDERYSKIRCADVSSYQC